MLIQRDNSNRDKQKGEANNIANEAHGEYFFENGVSYIESFQSGKFNGR